MLVKQGEAMLAFPLFATVLPDIFDDLARSGGAVAQLGARVNGIHEVAGSIPASSTKPHFVRTARSVSMYRNLMRADKTHKCVAVF